MQYAEIGAFEAKAILSKLLQEVMKGRCYTITLRGKPIADLIPSQKATHHDVHDAVSAIQNISKIKGVSLETLSLWVKEGRR